MTTPYETLKEHLTTNDWNYESHDEAKLIRTGFSGESANLKSIVAIDEDDDLIQCITTYQCKAPPQFREVVAELICRANYGMKIGKFELDYNDGEIRFQTSSAFLAGVLPDDVIRRVFGTNFLIADRYYPAFMKVLFGGYSPIDAIEEVEGRTADDETAEDEEKEES